MLSYDGDDVKIEKIDLLKHPMIKNVVNIDAEFIYFKNGKVFFKSHNSCEEIVSLPETDIVAKMELYDSSLDEDVISVHFLNKNNIYTVITGYEDLDKYDDDEDKDEEKLDYREIEDFNTRNINHLSILIDGLNSEIGRSTEGSKAVDTGFHEPWLTLQKEGQNILIYFLGYRIWEADKDDDERPFIQEESDGDSVPVSLLSYLRTQVNTIIDMLKSVYL